MSSRQLSRYNILVPLDDDSGKALVLNTLSGGLFEFEPDYVASYTRLRDGAALTTEDEARLDEMAAEGFVISSVESERHKLAAQMRRNAFGGYGDFSAVVLTTMDCNLACRYCFELGMENRRSMTAETAAAVIEWIERRAEDNLARNVSIDFYGGEPLANRPVIVQIATALKSWCEAKNLKWGFSMTTNGTLLTRAVAEELLPLGFKAARVTLDGPPEMHDGQRPFKGGRGSYETIVRNLDEVVDILPVTVNVLFRDSIEPIRRLMDDLEARGLLDRIKNIAPGVESSTFEEAAKGCRSQNCRLEAEQAALFVEGMKLVHARGRLDVSRPVLSGHNCPLATANNGDIIAPDGEIHRCPTILGERQFAIGHVTRGKYDDVLFDNLAHELWQKCEATDCPYVPLCGTGAGCRQVAWDRSGDLWGDACNRGFYDVYCRDGMKLEYDIRTAGAAKGGDVL
jgi:uncharacterized protein